MDQRQNRKLLKAADGAYPDGMITRASKEGASVGDGLAEFIAREIGECDEGNTPHERTRAVIERMERAARELDEVLRVLREVRTRGPKNPGPRKKLKDFIVYWKREGAKTYKAANAEAAMEAWGNDPNAPDLEATTDVYAEKGALP